MIPSSHSTAPSSTATQPLAATEDSFDPMWFVKPWTVVEGDSGIGQNIEIKYDEAKKRFLLCREDGTVVQVLCFDSVARTLVDAENLGPYRCISFWNQPIRGRFRIFAMRMPRQVGSTEGLLDCEITNPDRGTWGAEEGWLSPPDA